MFKNSNEIFENQLKKIKNFSKHCSQQPTLNIDFDKKVSDSYNRINKIRGSIQNTKR
ncbi:hypothetical protein SAMN04487885_12336 [Clostridium cadaveris]|uniref:Uncharacterized protein n=1 Tax=Clostridium cadaveris TaxID=1529 RepID=A0A1I2NPM8_9CLOT|nr:hypothetical protein SAMN04487885_12336 [Clostridium cadaveris]